MDKQTQGSYEQKIIKLKNYSRRDASRNEGGVVKSLHLSFDVGFGNNKRDEVPKEITIYIT